MRLVGILSILINFSLASWAQDARNDSQVQGVWVSSEDETKSFNWTAQWIWLDDKTDSHVMLARRTFELTQLPDQAQLRITASTQYQLFINGQYVRRGPARSAPHHQSFDILDINSLLQTGQNTIAVRVHHQKGKFSYHLAGRAGLLVQLDLSVGEQQSSIVTDSNWKVSPDPAWDNAAARISRFQLVVNDLVDLRQQIKDWETPTFNDSEWPNATPLMRKVGWPGPQKNAQAQALTPPWTNLVAREVPYLKEIEERATNLIVAMPMTSNPLPLNSQINTPIATALVDYQQGNGPLEISTTDGAEPYLLLFDFGKVLNGMPQLDIEGAAGTEVEILCAPFIVNNQFTQKVVDSEFRDRITLSGKRDQWEATYFKPTRYLGILIKGVKSAVKLHHASILHFRYPFELKGKIHSTDAEWVGQYMEAATKTIDVCTTDAYTDNYRERRQYAQTGYYAALGNYWTFGDHALQRRYLVQVAQEQEANGMMPAYAPLAMDDYMIIMDSNCLWIRSLRNYFLHSGDTKTVKELLPAARKLMDLLHSYTHDLGFICNPPYPYWLDHALNDRRGANLNLNGHYLGALEDFAEILDWLGKKDSSIFQSRADLLRQSLRTHLWDEEKQLFADAWIDGKRSDRFSEHGNAMALAMMIATPEQAKSVAQKVLADDRQNFIKRASGMTVVTPAMSYFLHKGLCNYGYVKESFNLFRQRFDQMLAPKTNGTLWEEWWLDGTGRSGKFQGGRTRSDAQTESAFPPALFAEFLLGVNPSKPGMKEIEIAKPNSGLSNIQATLPSPEGLVEINWKLAQETGSELVLEIPGDMLVKLDLASLASPTKKSIIIDGKRVLLKDLNSSFIFLSRGSHSVSF